MPETWNDSFQPEAEVKGKYVNFDEYDVEQPKLGATKGLSHTSADASGTRHEHLEYGTEGV